MSSEETKIPDSEAKEEKPPQNETEPEKPESEKVKESETKEKEEKNALNDTKMEVDTNEDATDADGDTEEEKTEVKKPAKKRPVKTDEETKNEKADTEEDENDDKEEDEEEENDDEKKNGVEEKDEKKKEEREVKKDDIDIPNGKGVQFSECPRIEFFIKQKETDHLKKLHQVLFGKVGKPEKIKSNLLLFKGFDYEPESDIYIKKKQYIAKMDVKHLKDICEVIDVEKKGRKEEIVNRIMDFLMDPKDSGKALPPQPSPRPKRTSAVKANNRGYAGLDGDDSEEEDGVRGRGRSTGRRNKSRPSYKDESSSEDERRGRRGGGKKYAESDDEAASEPEMTPSESDSDSPKKKKGALMKSKGKMTTKRKRAPAKSAKKTFGKTRGKKKAESESEGPSESEDEPLQKKSKKPPTDEEIKKYVKQILDGANLEEITMKTVCKQVYGRYPDHDLTHKKDLIKTTVKSIISSGKQEITA